MKIFITGAMGFIGSHVAYRFLDAGHDLVALARNPHKLPALAAHPKVQIVAATLYDFDVIREALQGCDACIHIALGWGDTPIEMLMTDTTATVSLLTSCLDAGIKQFIYTSSTAALGSFFAEMKETDPVMPSDYYGATKAASEAFALAVAAKSNMRCNIIRPGYTFGNPVKPGASIQSDRRFHDIVSEAVNDGEIVLKAGDGTQFIAAADLARLFEAVFNSDRNREVYYGLGVPFISWASIAETTIKLCSSKSSIRLIGEVPEPCLFNLGKIQRHFGLAFEAEPYLTEHLKYLIGGSSSRAD